MTLQYSPFESYFDTAGRPTAAGQQLLSRIGQIFTSAEAAIAAVHGIPSGGAAGQVLAKSTAADYEAEWANSTGGAGDVTLTWMGM